MPEPEYVTVAIKSGSDLSVDLLPDVLRQLGAMVRLLTEFASDPSYSKVEVLSIEKNSPLEARLRVVTIRTAPKAPVRAPRKGIARPAPKPVIRNAPGALRHLEKAFHAATAVEKPKSFDPSDFTALMDCAKQLKKDEAVITTKNETLVLNSTIIDQINNKLGPLIHSHGTITGVLESLNVHSKPWSFTIYPEIGPSKVRCYFDESLFPSVQKNLRNVVTVEGGKEYSLESPWPVKMIAEKIEVRHPAKPGAWLELLDNMAELWDNSPEDEVNWLLEDYGA